MPKCYDLVIVFPAPSIKTSSPLFKTLPGTEAVTASGTSVQAQACFRRFQSQPAMDLVIE